MPLLKIPFEAIQEAIDGDSYTGFCLACGGSQEGVEPDGREIACLSCGEQQVFGAEEIVIMNMVDADDCAR